MSTPNVPRDLKDWNVDVLNSLLTVRDVESDRFDFKGGDLGDLAIHICAMANLGEGIMILGVDENKNGEFLVEFEKKGYSLGKEDTLKRQITDYIAQVDPAPKVTVESIKDIDGKFYPTMKIEGEEMNKPYMLKNRGQIYVRINSSSMPASRITILNLFSRIREQLVDVQRLKTTCLATRNALILTARVIGYGNTTSWTIIPPVDLTFLKNAAMQAEWFLTQNGKYGEILENGHKSGMQVHIHSLDRMNTFIETFNRAPSPHDKQLIMQSLAEWTEKKTSFTDIVAFFDGVVADCDNFIRAKG